MSGLVDSDDGIADILRNTRTIALVGASPKANRPSHGVMAALLRAGYRVIPVNPAVTGQTILGETVVASLAEIEQPIDMVDVFRRAEDTPELAHEAVAAGAKTFWLQLGIVNHEAADIVMAGGLNVVMDRCTAIEVRRLIGR